MSYRHNELLKGVIECLEGMERRRPKHGIDENTNPIHDLGCDSPDGIDFACVIHEHLGIYIPENINPFVDDNAHNRPRKIREIVALLESLVEEEASHV